MVVNILDDVVKRPRNLEYQKKNNNPPNKVLWVQTFGPATKLIKNIVKEANVMLQKCTAWSSDKNPIGVVCKRATNIADMILKRKKYALATNMESTGSARCTPLISDNIGNKRGRPCSVCPLMSNRNSITSTATGKFFKTHYANCKSRNVIYCAECYLCRLQYTGKTTTFIRSRICVHRSHVGDSMFDDESDEAALAEHLQVVHKLDSVDHFNSNYTFTILENSPKDLDASEQRWVSRLMTMRPFGLNKEKPGGVVDSITSMCKRSLDCVIQR